MESFFLLQGLMDIMLASTPNLLTFTILKIV
jgi:hypothetical protein